VIAAPTPRGNADQCENKGVAGKAIRKNMKTKDEEEPWTCHRDTEAPSWEIPPPPVFCRKSLDLLDYKGVDFFGSAKEFVTVSNDEG
jgi:hypothetical protein